MVMEAKRETRSSSSEETRVEVNVVKSKIKGEDKALKISSPKQDNLSIGNPKENDNELKIAKAEMSEVKEENERLKKMLDRIENDYTSLKMQFFEILQHEKSPTIILSPENKHSTNEENSEEDNETEVSLCLGLQSLKKRKKEDNNNTSSITKDDNDTKKLMSEGLSLGFQIKSRHSPTIDLSDKIISEKSGETMDDDSGKEDGQGETWSPNKGLKTTKEYSEKEDKTSQSSSTKRARVSVRARCDTPTMNDGCQWRKYGQKIAKGNPCPRAYYRCTVAPACPVRKQVQRCSEDMSVLITTYEGTHNHPLPAAANSMASTTSAAASILLSGSSTSQSGLTSFASTTMTTANLNGMNFTLYNNNPKPTNQFNLPISSSHNTPPTITLDLTSTPSTFFNRRYSSSSNYTSRSLDFSSSEPKTTFPIGSWTNNNNNLNYGSLFPSNNKANTDSISFGKPNYEQMARHYQYPITNPSTSQQFLTETLTKVLTSDPSFQSAVAAAISSMVGSSSTNSNSMISSINHANAEGSTHNIRWGDQVQGILDSSVSSTYLNKPTSSTSSNTQKIGNFMVQQHQPFSYSLTKNSSPPDPKN